VAALSTSLCIEALLRPLASGRLSFVRDAERADMLGEVPCGLALEASVTTPERPPRVVDPVRLIRPGGGQRPVRLSSRQGSRAGVRAR
jgi:hypothetical protein